MKTNLDKYFKTDSDIEKSGVWFTISDTTGFLVKPFNQTNTATKAAMAQHFKPFARQIELGTLEERKEREVLAKVFVNSCLVDWKGVEIDGVETKFDKEVAIKFLMELPELFKSLMEYAQDFKNYRDAQDEEVGNV